MRESEVTCLCTSLKVPELGLDLKKGDVVFLSLEQVKKANTLALAERSKGVQIRTVERCRTQKAGQVVLEATAPVMARSFIVSPAEPVAPPVPPKPRSKKESLKIVSKAIGGAKPEAEAFAEEPKPEAEEEISEGSTTKRKKRGS